MSADPVRLYLVRHGEAGPGSPDSRRTLTSAGRAAVARLATACVAAGFRVDQIRHSGLVRARETAEILAARLVPASGIEPMAGTEPDGDVEGAAIELAALDVPVLLVTHMPFVAELAGRLVSGRRSALAPAFATAELRGYEREAGVWRPVAGLSGGR